MTRSSEPRMLEGAKQHLGEVDIWTDEAVTATS